MEETPRSLSEMVQKTYLIRHRRREDKEADRDAILERIKRKEVCAKVPKLRQQLLHLQCQ